MSIVHEKVPALAFLLLVVACASSLPGNPPAPVAIHRSTEAPTPTRLHVGGQRVCVERSDDAFVCSVHNGPWEEFRGSMCLDGSQQCRTVAGGVRCDWGEHTWFVPIEGRNLVCAPLHICATAADESVSCEPFGMVGGLTAAHYTEIRILPTHAFSGGRPALAFGHRSACVRQHGGLRCWFLPRDPEPLHIPGPVEDFALAGESVCWVDSTRVLCAGFNAWGVFGPRHRDLRSSETPVEVASFEEVPVIAAYEGRLCAGSGRSVSCWGNAGFLWEGARAVSLAGDAVLLARSTHRVCAVLDTGCVQCWDDAPSPKAPVLVGGTCPF